MLIQRLTSLLKFLIGIAVLQAATALVAYTALQTDIAMTWPLFVAVGAAVGVLAALWFESISGGVSVQALARQQKRHAREREKLRLEAEREKARLAVRHTKAKGTASGKLKTGVALGGAAGVGVAMIFAQFVTLGLLTVATTGGAALGYTIRVRQEKRLRARMEAAGEALVGPSDLKQLASTIDAVAEQPALPRGKKAR